MTRLFSSWRTRFASAALLCACAAGSTSAQTLYASGQLFIPADPTHNDIRENRIYAIDIHTGQATPTSPVLSGTPPTRVQTKVEKSSPAVNGVLRSRTTGNSKWSRLTIQKTEHRSLNPESYTLCLNT